MSEQAIRSDTRLDKVSVSGEEDEDYAPAYRRRFSGWEICWDGKVVVLRFLIKA